MSSSDSSRPVPPAALYLASPEDAEAGRLDVAGLPVAFRALMSALHAGCPSVAVPAVYRGTEVDRAIGRSARARAHTVWLDGDNGEAPLEPMVLLPATVVAAAHGAPRAAGGPARGRDRSQSARGARGPRRCDAPGRGRAAGGREPPRRRHPAPGARRSPRRCRSRRVVPACHEPGHEKGCRAAALCGPRLRHRHPAGPAGASSAVAASHAGRRGAGAVPEPDQPGEPGPRAPRRLLSGEGHGREHPPRNPHLLRLCGPGPRRRRGRPTHLCRIAAR